MLYFPVLYVKAYVSSVYRSSFFIFPCFILICIAIYIYNFFPYSTNAFGGLEVYVENFH